MTRDRADSLSDRWYARVVILRELGADSILARDVLMSCIADLREVVRGFYFFGAFGKGTARRKQPRLALGSAPQPARQRESGAVTLVAKNSVRRVASASHPAGARIGGSPMPSFYRKTFQVSVRTEGEKDAAVYLIAASSPESALSLLIGHAQVTACNRGSQVVTLEFDQKDDVLVSAD